MSNQQKYPNCKIARGAAVIGNVSFGEGCSVWYNAVVRGDTNTIKIGRMVNIQDGAILHVSPDFDMELGDYVSIAHGAIVHGAKVGDGSLIGMGAILLNGSKIGKDSLVAAGSLVPEGREYPDGALIMGSPARAVRMLKPEEIEKYRGIAVKYAERAATIEEA